MSEKPKINRYEQLIAWQSADALAELADDAELRQTLGEANRARAEERFDRKKVGARILDIYERVLAGPN